MSIRAPVVRASAHLPSATATVAGIAGGPDAGDSIDEEHLFDAARRAFDRGDLGAALAALQIHERDFPRGNFAAECELLRVKALVRSGRIGEAHARLDRLRRSAQGRALAEQLQPFLPSVPASAAPAD